MAVNDDFQWQYACTMYHVWAENTTETAATLLHDMSSQAINCPKGCTGMFQTNNGNGLSFVLSDIQMFPPGLCGISSWLNHVFDFAGDVVSGIVLTVKFPAEGLSLASELANYSVLSQMEMPIFKSILTTQCLYPNGTSLWLLSPHSLTTLDGLSLQQAHKVLQAPQKPEVHYVVLKSWI